MRVSLPCAVTAIRRSASANTTAGFAARPSAQLPVTVLVEATQSHETSGTPTCLDDDDPLRQSSTLKVEGRPSKRVLRKLAIPVASPIYKRFSPTRRLMHVS
jgi:ribosomal protein S12 methylthiotransferase accessory factor YcaO